MSKGTGTMMTKRIQIWYVFFILLILLLAGRLYYIQILCSDELSAAAVMQQQVPIIHPYTRGLIYDRKMEKLTNTTNTYYYLVEESRCTDIFKDLIDSIGGVVAGKKGETYIVYRVDHFQETINRLLQEEHGAYGFCVSRRYADQQTAAHLIGYLHEADGTGVSGLEKMYEESLGSIASDLYLVGDGIGQVADGMGLLRYDNGDQQPASLVTTIDGQLQKKVEEILQQAKFSGAVIIVDTETGQVLSMASCPTYNPNQLEQYLGNDSSELVNRAVQCAYAPGPVLDVVKSLAEDSSMGKQTNGEQRKRKISPMEMAASMGFGETVWENFPNEAAGYLGKNLSEMQVTPIQVCQMLTILANKGEKIPLSLVMHTAQGESIPCANLTSAATNRMEKLQKQIEKKPLIGNGWAFGYGNVSPYAIVVYGENGKARMVYQQISKLLS